jgi:hypothetical protein
MPSQQRKKRRQKRQQPRSQLKKLPPKPKKANLVALKTQIRENCQPFGVGSF